MNCTQARQLFDAYLDGELSSSLVTELSAHRVRCASCRRELALLEVTGRVLALDQEPVRTRADFTDRLLACVESGEKNWFLRVRRRLYLGIPLAAAALIALTVLGVFDRGTGRLPGDSDSLHPRVLGEKVTHRSVDSKAVDAVLGTLESGDPDCDTDTSWLNDIPGGESSLQSKDVSSEPSATDPTVLQMLQLLEGGSSKDDRAFCPNRGNPPQQRQSPPETDDTLEPL